MIVDAVIDKIRAIDPQPFASVEGIGELAALTGAPAVSPAAYVFESQSAAGQNQRMNGVLQRVETDITVVIVVRDVSDAVAGAAGSWSAPLERSVAGALVGWTPDGADDVVTIVSARTVKARGGEIWRELVFAIAWYLEV